MAESADQVSEKAVASWIGRTPSSASAASGPGWVLALQRAAGNRSTTQVLSRPPDGLQRVLARCQGHCTCGGRCGRHQEQEEELAPHRALGHVLARCQGRCTCGGRCRADDENDAAFGRELRRAVLARQVHGAADAGFEEPVNAALQQGVPAEKWSPTIEAQYRARGDVERAGAIRACREQGGNACARLLTPSEADGLRRLAQRAGGDPAVLEAGLPAVAPLLAPRPTVPPLRLVPPPPPAPAPTPAPGPATGPRLVGGLGPALLAALVIIEIETLMELAAFQQWLRQQGFIVLESPLAVCIGGCHMPSRPPADFPRLNPIPPSPNPADPDLDAIRRWLEDTPRATQPGPSPAPPPVSPTPSPTPIPGPRRWPNQTCENNVLDAVQDWMHDACDRVPGESCSPSKVSPKRLDRRPCSAIRARLAALRECLRRRDEVQRVCFSSTPDPRHQRATNEINNAINACVALEAINCAPGHPMANL